VNAESLKDSYLPDEEITFLVSVENNSGEPIQLEQFPPDIQIERSTSNAVVNVIHSNGAEKIVPPGQTVSITISWDQTDDQGNPVEYGYYRIKPEDIHYNAKQNTEIFSPIEIQIVSSDEEKGE
jgi:flagellar hook assembly protein FlgD